MSERFPKLDKEGEEMLYLLAGIARRIRGDELYALDMRIKNLRSEALKRSLDWRHVGKQYADSCILCHGTGKHHFCMNPFCKSENPLEKEDCLHFTPDELQRYQAIQDEYLHILHGIHSLIEAGTLPKDLLAGSTQPSDPSQLN